MNLATDLIYAVIDPRINLLGKRLCTVIPPAAPEVALSHESSGDTRATGSLAPPRWHRGSYIDRGHRGLPVGAAYRPAFSIRIAAGPILSPPTTEFWFGTDELGRDVFSRVLYGGQTSLQLVGLAVLLAFVAGRSWHLSGFFGGIADAVIMRITDAMLAFPRSFSP